MSVALDTEGKYSTDLFNDEAIRIINEHDTSTPMFMYLSHLAPHSGNEDDPYQAPDEEIAKFAHIDDPERRIYAGINHLHLILQIKKKNSDLKFLSSYGIKA